MMRVNTTKAAFKALTQLRRRPGLETDFEKAKKAKEAGIEDKAAPKIKKISKAEAKEQSEAGKRRVTPKKEESKETTKKPE